MTCSIFIKRSRTRRKKFEFIFDAEDAEELAGYSWYMNNKGYAIGHRLIGHAGKLPGIDRCEPLVSMHRLIMKAPKGSIVDHVNNNPRDNRKINLRFATKSQNGANSKDRKRSYSPYRGVAWMARDRKWIAQTSVLGKRICGPYRDTPEEAARDYDRIALESFKEFARLNFPCV